MTFEKMNFKGEWREYQKQVLDELANQQHMDQHKDRMNIVAAPGSGKTTLGLEIMRRIGKPSIILVPNITIRNQWVERLVSMFMSEQEAFPDWISKDIRKPKFLTVTTYQALHAILSGIEEKDDGEIQEEDKIRHKATIAKITKRKADEKTKVIALLKKQKISTIILDESHHLRKEWWKALADLRVGIKKVFIISLTATPPYDVDANEWDKYEELCGPIDIEISVPELVSCGDLCPHQDYIRFSLPTRQESEKISQFKEEVNNTLSALRGSPDFLKIILMHPWINDTENHMEFIFKDPKFFSAILIFLNSVGQKIPHSILNILGVKQTDLPELNLMWFETLLNIVVHIHNDYFVSCQKEIDVIRKELRQIGALKNQTVTLENTKESQNLIANSSSKLDSILDITQMEAEHLDENLRMVILADYIRKEYLASAEDTLRHTYKIGVIPIFENLRRAGIKNIKLGVLTGSIIIIPKNAELKLKEAAQNMCIDPNHVFCYEINYDNSYIHVSIHGEQKQKIVQLITDLFNAGDITVLVGTQALLGEGWDSPSANTLIFTSSVSSYMLSNQMRGRVIRADPHQPNKIANIWHLATLDIETLKNKPFYTSLFAKKKQEGFDIIDEIKEDIGVDIKVLCKRFRTFEGLSYEYPPVIKNGFGRFNFSNIKWNFSEVNRLNKYILNMASERHQVAQLWHVALQGSNSKLNIHRPKMQEKIESNHAPRGYIFTNTLKRLLKSVLAGIMGCVYSHFFELIQRSKARNFKELIFVSVASFMLLLTVGLIKEFPKLLRVLYLFIRYGTLENSMYQVGWAIVETLHHMRLIKTNLKDIKVRVNKCKSGVVYCSLDGVTRIEKMCFLKALQEVLNPIGKPRYLIVRRSNFGGFLRVDYHSVPEVIGRNKQDAEYFAKCWMSYVGSIELIYAYSVEGRAMLLKARAQSFSASFQKKADRVSIWE